jgi:hypothetical protein
MWFCFFLVCCGNDSGLFVRRFFEFLRGGDSVGCFLCVILQVLRIPKEPANGNFFGCLATKKEPIKWFFFFFKLSSLNFTRS